MTSENGLPGIQLESMASPKTTRILWVGLGLIIGVYCVVAVLYSIYTPAWQVPDEPAHYNYIRHLAEERSFPILEFGDYDQQYLSTLTSSGFPPELSIETLEYEDHQPPLYYLLSTPVFLASGGVLLPIRLLSVVFGAGVVAFSGLAIWTLFPGNAPLAIIVAGVVAFVPQHVAMLAGINNDSLSEFWIAFGLWLLFLCMTSNIKRSRRWYLALGIVIGLGLLTKTLAYLLVPVAAIGLFLKARRENLEWRQTVRIGLWIFVPAGLLGLLWWGRNLSVYGWPDLLGLQRHNLVVLGQPRTAEWIEQFGVGEYALRFFQTTFNSFWGQFGWMGVLMDARVYLLLQFLTGAILLGAVYVLWLKPTLGSLQRDGLWTLFVMAAITTVLYLAYNVEFVQHQGRYLFPALTPLATGMAFGLLGWSTFLTRRWPGNARLVVWLPVTIVPFLAALSLFALFRFIVPALG